MVVALGEADVDMAVAGLAREGDETTEETIILARALTTEAEGIVVHTPEVVRDHIAGSAFKAFTHVYVQWKQNVGLKPRYL